MLALTPALVDGILSPLMKKIILTFILILCFGLSSVNAALAAQIVDSSPIIVQPYDLRDISQQMLEQDRINRDKVLAMEINQTMIKYSRVSKYHDLITLTEDVDGMKGVGQTLQLKSDGIEDQYKILTELKDEMMALNEKLKMYQRIAQLQESVRWLKQVLAAAKYKAEYYQLTFVSLKNQADLLKSELEHKITQENNQGQQEARIQQDLKVRLQDKENQITAMKTAIQSGQKTQAQADTLRQQLADQQNNAALLKQELESKTTESDKATLMMEDYQKKLESRDNANNEQLGQILSSRNDQARMEAQIADLNARLQEKEAQVVKIKKDMYDLQELTRGKDRDLQAKDLSLSTELALARQRLSGMPSSDEIDYLRTGLKVATVQLKQKDAMLGPIKASADEYEKEFKEQALQFQNLKEQLQNAYVDINHKNEDLKYKDMAIIRLKERFSIQGKPNENNAQALPKGDRLREKLKQALDKIDEQGRLINALARKLQECGQSVDLTRQ